MYLYYHLYYFIQNVYSRGCKNNNNVTESNRYLEAVYNNNNNNVTYKAQIHTGSKCTMSRVNVKQKCFQSLVLNVYALSFALLNLKLSIGLVMFLALYGVHCIV